MQAAWLRRQSGQAVVLVAIAVLVLTAILALALDGGGIYLDKRQLQNAADSAALAGAEALMNVPPNYTTVHSNAMSIIVKNLPGTSTPGGFSPGANQTRYPSVGSQSIGAGYSVVFTVTSATTFQVQLTHAHPVAVAPIHGFQSTIALQAQATAQNADLPYAIVLFQDSYSATYHDFNMNGTPVHVILKRAASVGGDKGGMFSDASINPGEGDITFSPCAQAGDLWAYDEDSNDGHNVQMEVNGSQAGGAAQCTSPPSTYPLVATRKLTDPGYPEPPVSSATYAGVSNMSGTMYLCPGTYNGSIVNQGNIILMPGVYKINGSITLSGNAGSSFVNASASTTFPPPAGATTNCAATPAPPADGDYGVVIEMVPSNTGGPSCNTNQFSLTGQQTITLTSSPKYNNINLYVEKIGSNWQSICSAAPYGSNVVNIAGQAGYSIQGALYGPADNMAIGGNGATEGVGQVVAWTMSVSGNGNLTETYDPTALPYLKGLIQ